MGIFDGVFNTGPQNEAAGAQIAGINSGYQQLADMFGQGRDALKTNVTTGQQQLAGATNTGIDQLRQNYYAGLSPLLNNYNVASQGTSVLGNALGLNGQAGSDAAVAAFQANPSYKFGLDQGEAAIAAQAQKGGMGASGNALNAAGQFATNYANQNWNNYIGQLQPYLNMAQGTAGNIASTYGNLGNNINASQTNLGNNMLASFSGLGAGLNQSDMTQGNAIYGADTSKGNAQANAALAQAGTNANTLNTLGQGAKAIMAMLSDEGMKDDIEQVGELYDGQPVVRYRMKGDPRHQIGLIAQNVEKEIPDAVVQFTPHVKGVDYKRATDRAAEIFRFMEVA